MPQIRSRLLWRRSATAIATYLSVALGVAGTLVAARVLGPGDFGRFSIVVVAAAFFQVLLDVTGEEALVKYGFRYSTGESWGKLRRLFGRILRLKLLGGLLAGAALLGLAPLADGLFGTGGLAVPFAVAAAIPLVQAPEGVASSALILRGRYDVRGAFLVVSQLIRFAAIVVGAQLGVTGLVAALVAGQVLASAAVGAAGWRAFRRFPPEEPVSLADDRPDIVRFVLQSSVATGLVSFRTTLGTLLLGVVSNAFHVGYFRVAQAPQAAFTALSSPARLILLTEQTRDWERGEHAAVFRGVHRYMAAAAAAMAVVVPPLVWLMPEAIRLFYGGDYGAATDAARIIVVAAALQLVFGWTKSFPVSIGKPSLRIVVYGLEALVLIPLVVVLGREWGAAGAAGAVLASTAAASAAWTILLLRVERSHRSNVAVGAASVQRQPAHP